MSFAMPGGRGERLGVDDIDPSMSAPVVYIAFRWYWHDASGDANLAAAAAAAEPHVVMLPLAPRAPQYVEFTHVQGRGAVRPIWSSRGTTVLESFGAASPYDDIALVAAFPAAALEARRPFVIFKDDVAAWR